MKKYNVRNIISLKLISVLVVFVFLFSLLFFPFNKVYSTTVYNYDVGTSVNNAYRSTNIYVGYGSEAWYTIGSISVLSSGSNTVHVWTDDLSINNTYNNVGLKYYGNHWAIWFGGSAGTYNIEMTFNNCIYYDTSWSVEYILNGYFKGKITVPSSGSGSVNNLTPSFKLIYNNDYNYTSNKASFTMQYSNFSFNYFTLLNTDAVSNGGFGGFHLLNYSISNNIVNCTFDNTYETMSNPHYLFYIAHGLDSSGNAIDLSGSINFNINVDTTPKVKSYKVSYVMDGSPCIAGSGGGRLYLYIDYGAGYVLQDVTKWSVTISQVANGGQDTFTYGIDTNFNTAYKISITKVDDIDTYNYDIYVNDTAKHLTGQLKVCSNDDYIFDAYGSQTSGQETDIFTLLKEIKDIIIGFWNLILSIVDFFGALLIAIFSIAYSMGVAVISLLKIVVDFVASVSSILFNRNTNYYSLINVMSLPNSFTYEGKVIALSGVWGVVDNQLKYIHDNIIIQYSGIWAVIGLIYLIKKHILIEKVEDEDNE